MKELLEFLIRSLVDDPDAVIIDEKVAEGQSVLFVKVAPAEVGKIIGRQGRTIKALRAVITAAGRKRGSQTSIEIAES